MSYLIPFNLVRAHQTLTQVSISSCLSLQASFLERISILTSIVIDDYGALVAQVNLAKACTSHAEAALISSTIE